MQKTLARADYSTDSDPDDETHWPYQRTRPPRRQRPPRVQQSPVDWLFAAPNAAPSASGQSAAGSGGSAQAAVGPSSAAAVAAADALPDQLNAVGSHDTSEEVAAVTASEISDLLCCPITHVRSLCSCLHDPSVPLCLPPVLPLLLLLARGPFPFVARSFMPSLQPASVWLRSKTDYLPTGDHQRLQVAMRDPVIGADGYTCARIVACTLLTPTLPVKINLDVRACMCCDIVPGSV